MGSSLDYTQLISPMQRCIQSRAVQTDLTINKIKELESKSAMDLEIRDNRIDELQRVRSLSLFSPHPFFFLCSFLFCINIEVGPKNMIENKR